MGTDSEERLLELDRALLDPIDAAFAKVRDSYPGALPCSRGCSYCCVAFFPITVADIWRLQRGLNALRPAQKAQVESRAVQVLTLARTVHPDWSVPWGLDDLGERGFNALGDTLSASCPALGDDGECLVYAHRPRLCRLQGISLVDVSGSVSLPDHCSDVMGDEAYSAIPPQPLDLFEQWELEGQLRREVCQTLPMPLSSAHRTIVAGAVELWARWQSERPFGLLELEDRE